MHQRSLFFLLLAATTSALPNVSRDDTTTATTENASASTAAVPDYSSVASIYASMVQESTIAASSVPIAVLNDDPMGDLLSTLTDTSFSQPALNIEQFTETFNALHEHAFDNITSQISGGDNSTSQMSKRAAGKKVMIVGDSMTQGSAGDWTWRYRIWQWQKAQGLNWQFVGPYTGTQHAATAQAPQAPPLYGSKPASGPLNTDGGYAADCSPDFLKDGGYNHFSIWGRAVAFDISTQPGDSVPLIQKMVQQYQPDIILLMLGFNDVGWFYSDGQGLLNNMGTMVSQIRTANPNVAIALANVVQRRWLGRTDLVQKTNYYDSRIQQYVNSWSTAQSPIRLVRLREYYDCDISSCPAGSDGLHPNSLGDIEIAQAFSLVLTNDPTAFGISPNAQPLSRPSPLPKRPMPVPSNFKVVASQYGVTATWDPVYGAYGYKIQYQLDDQPWQSGLVQANRWDTTWPFDGHKYTIKVASTAGDYDNSDFTAAQSATSNSQIAPGPVNPRSQPYGSDGLRVDWDAPTGPNSGSISEYQIIIWDKDSQCAFISGAAFKSSPAIITGLNPGHRYMVAPCSWNNGGLSFPTFANDVRINAGTPGTPSTPVIKPIDQISVHATWNGDSNASGWTIYSRNVNNASDTSKPLPISPSKPCADLGILFPGYWNYEFCVQAYNGNNALSGKSGCTVLPSPTASIVPAATCAPDPPWCPGFGQDTTPSTGSGSLGDGGGDAGGPPVVQSGGAKAGSSSTQSAAYGPSPTVGSLGKWATGSWTSVTCGATPSNTALAGGLLLGNTPMNQDQATAFWHDSGADGALQDLIKGWDGKSNFETYLSNSIFSFEAGTGQCGNIDGSGCLAPPSCATQYNRPALYYLALSLRQLNSLYLTFRTSYTDATIQALGKADSWSKTFVQTQNEAAVKVQQSLLNTLSAFISLPLERVFGPLQNVLSKTISDVVKTGITNGISQGIMVASDNLKATTNVDDTTLSLQRVLTNYYGAVKGGASDSLKAYFNGTYVSLLPKLLGNGGFNIPNDLGGYFDPIISRDLSNLLFQNGWALTSTGFNIPYVLFIPYYVFQCGTGTAADIKGTVEGDSHPGASYMTYASGTPEVDTQYAPIDSVYCDPAGNGYLLYNAGYPASQKGSSASGYIFEQFPGLDQLSQHPDTWGYVSQEIMVRNAFSGYLDNGFRNDGSPPSFVADPFSAYSLPDGFFPFPVCTSIESASSGTKSPNGQYPPCGVDGAAPRTEAAKAYLRNKYGYGPGTCYISFKIYDGQKNAATADIYINDHFNASLQTYSKQAFTNNVITTSSALGTININIDYSQVSNKHELLTFTYGQKTWKSTDSVCEQRGYDNSGKFWTSSCSFLCGS